MSNTRCVIQRVELRSMGVGVAVGGFGDTGQVRDSESASLDRSLADKKGRPLVGLARSTPSQLSYSR